MMNLSENSAQPPKDNTTYDLSLLDQSRAKWNSSPGLRTVYGSFITQMLESRTPGSTLEIGSGCGILRDFDPNIETSDIEKTRFVDRRISAYSIHRNQESWDNILALDVFHHLTDPFAFIQSAAKALSPGGKLILCEPASTPFGRFFYNLFHQEPCSPHLYSAPYNFEEDENGEFANMAAGWALFERDQNNTHTALDTEGLEVELVHFRDFLAYPLTGGFSKPCLLPSPILKLILSIESLIPQFILKFLALRMIIVVKNK